MLVPPTVFRRNNRRIYLLSDRMCLTITSEYIVKLGLLVPAFTLQTLRGTPKFFNGPKMERKPFRTLCKSTHDGELWEFYSKHKVRINIGQHPLQILTNVCKICLQRNCTYCNQVGLRIFVNNVTCIPCQCVRNYTTYS